MRYCFIEREVGHSVGWNDVQMAMGNFETRNDERDTSAVVQLLLSVPNVFCHSHEVIGRGCR